MLSSKMPFMPPSSPELQDLERLSKRYQVLKHLLRAVLLVWVLQGVFVVFYIQAVAEPACRRHAAQVGGVYEGLYWAGGRGGVSPHFLIGHCRYRVDASPRQPDSGRLQRVSLWSVMGWAMLFGVLIKPWSWVLTGVITALLVAVRHPSSRTSPV